MTDTNTARQSGADTDVMGRARQAASGAAESASNLASQASGLAGKAASALASEAQTKAAGMMQQQMEMGADYVRMVSKTAHTAARELEGKAPELARIVHDLADRAEGFATDLRRRQAHEMVEMAYDFARRNPRMFLGGAIAAGFLLTRFAKSSAEHAASANRRASSQGYQPSSHTPSRDSLHGQSLQGGAGASGVSGQPERSSGYGGSYGGASGSTANTGASAGAASASSPGSSTTTRTPGGAHAG